MPMQLVGLIIEDLQLAIFDRVGGHPSASNRIGTAHRPLRDFRRSALKELDCLLNSFPLVFRINIVAANAADEKIISYAGGTAWQQARLTAQAE